MRQFLIKSLLLSVCALATAYCIGNAVLSVNSKEKFIKFSNSICLDAKIYEVKKKLFGKEIDTLIIGSSMALNNFSSEAFRNYAGDTVSFYNFAAWGL